MLTFRKGGIHPPQNKFTDASHIIEVELPMQVAVTLKQHIGMAATPIVKKGEHVVRGQKIGEAQGRVSAPVHAPISGTVEKIDLVYNTSGMSETAIYIKASMSDHEADECGRKIKSPDFDWRSLNPENIIAVIANLGVVGLGGATFPTAMKLSPPPDSKPSMLIINAAECEPFLTCDDALMRAYPDDIIKGIEIMMYAAKVKKAIIGIEDNKPAAYQALSKAIGDSQGIEIRQMKTKYPQGGEKQLIKTLTGAEVPSGALPISVGVIVQNVATAYAVYKAVAKRRPLVEKVITVSGYGNYLVPIGMMLCDLPIDATQQYTQADVIIGGPMMGRSAATLNAPIEKGTSGITIIPSQKFDPQPCIRCGECVQACPMGLEPYLLSTYGRLRKVTEAVANGALDCIECGSCNYSCPSSRPIIDYIRLAKTMYRNRPATERKK